MTHSLVVDLANSLKPEEAVAFKKFLQSEFFNQDVNVQDLERLYDLIQQAKETGDEAVLEKENAYSVVFPGKPWVRNKLEKLASDLNKMFRTFLLTRRYFAEDNDMQSQLDWLKELRQRGLSNRYQHATEKYRKDLKGEHFESLNRYYYQQELAKEEHEWHSQYHIKGDLKLTELIEYVDNYHATYRTELLNRLLLQHKHTVLENTSIELIGQPWEVSPKKLQQSPLLQITWSIHQLLKAISPDDASFHALMQMIKKYESSLHPEEVRAFYTYLRNLCTILIDLGHVSFFAVLHEIQKDNLVRGYFYIDGKILPFACLSIIQMACRVNATTWALEFLEAHKDRIFDDNDEREYYRVNLALCLFAEKKYDDALEQLNFDSTFSSYHLIARRLELKIYYEMQSDLLPYKIDAFSMFIRRTGQKVFSPDVFELNLNFVNLLRQLSQSTDLLDNGRSDRLTQRIHAKTKVAERLWLLEKAAALARTNKK
jgi:hypothetical protein